MSFRARIALVAAAAVAIAVVAASGVVYLVVKGQLCASVDAPLRSQHGPHPARPADRLRRRGRRSPASSAATRRRCAGTASRTPAAARAARSRSNEHVLRVARGQATRSSRTRTSAETHIRMITFPYARLRRADRKAARRHRPRALPDQALALLHRRREESGRGGARARGLAHRPCSGPAADRATETVTETRDLSERIESADATSWRVWRRASTRCSPRSKSRPRAHGSSSPTRRTSCARR